METKKPEQPRLTGAEEECISHEQEAIVQWLKTVRFRKRVFGGVDEVQLWKKLEELYALYTAAICAERTRYDALRAAAPPEASAEAPAELQKEGCG